MTEVRVMLLIYLLLLQDVSIKVARGRPRNNGSFKNNRQAVSSDILGNLLSRPFNLDYGSSSDENDEDYDEYLDSFDPKGQQTVNLGQSKLLKADTFFLPPGLSLNSNLTAAKLIGLPEGSVAPEYMLELYNRFSKDHLSSPASSIVRSFMNINKEDVHLLPDTLGRQAPGDKTRVHTLVFNITSIAPEEDIILAELRLFTLVERDRNTYVGVDRKVSVFEIIPTEKRIIKRIISSKHIYGRNSEWETFDVTSAVRRWINNAIAVQILEVRIDSIFSGDNSGDMDINISADRAKDPLLVVFSDDKSKDSLHARERHEILTHEYNTIISRTAVRTNSSSNSNHGSDVQRSRVKRGAKKACGRKPLYVNFEDIDWHTWIIAPRGYQAYECSGKCYFPLDDHLTPTKHATIQTRLHTSFPKRTSRACCVPTKLDPISILYIDEQGVITYKYKYDGMVVAECGCR
ncbi:hypothetical protein CHS0354_008611 [Potamilus streckersoni]|uniref:TGF-beta family profile domain-containing protein n=1 Tax=Potamilus streckersoni TaxID=2493646 RepID=A0AAE0SVU2_9BIVA|nr:hypothetical protein CHS0354_008611 [Potamilus streckersoni]